MSDAITIDLDKIGQARAYDAGSMFFREEMARALKILAKLARDAEDAWKIFDNDNSSFEKLKNENLHHSHDGMLIMGDRGVGKTSFLLGIQDSCSKSSKKNEEQKNFSNETKEDLATIDSKLCFLPILDPNLLEDTEYFLITVVSMIRERINSIYNKNLHNSECCIENSTPRERMFQAWQQSLAKLSEHFGALGGLGYMESLKNLAGTPELFAEEMLQMGKSGRALSRAFHKFVHESLSILNVLEDRQNKYMAFVLMIDDIDAAYDKGWKVLESIRRYLSTPEIIVVGAGDPNLYRLVVHMEQMERVKSLEKDYKEKQDQVKTLLTNLEKEYLRKLFPHQYRVTLTGLREKIYKGEVEERYKKESEKKGFLVIKKPNSVGEEKGSLEVPLRQLFKSFCTYIYWGAKDTLWIGPFPEWNPITKIFPSSTRSFLQFTAHVLTPYFNCALLSPEEKGNQPAYLDKLNEDVVRKLIEVNMGDLYRYGMDGDTLFSAIDTPQERWLFHCLLYGEYKGPDIKRFQRGYRLEPLYDKGEKNRIVLTLQAVWNLAVKKNILRIGEYWFLVCQPWLTAAEQIENKGEDLKQYLSYVHYASSDQARDMVAWDICWPYRKNIEETKKKVKFIPNGPGFYIVYDSSTIFGAFKSFEGLRNIYSIEQFFMKFVVKDKKKNSMTQKQIYDKFKNIINEFKTPNTKDELSKNKVFLEQLNININIDEIIKFYDIILSISSYKNLIDNVDNLINVINNVKNDKLIMLSESCYIIDFFSFFIQNDNNLYRHISFVYGMACFNAVLTNNEYLPVTENGQNEDFIIYQMLDKLGQVKIHSVAQLDFEGYTYKLNESPEYDISYFRENNMLWNQIAKWRSKYVNEKLNHSIPVLGGIWRRFWSNLSALGKPNEANANIAYVLQFSAACFLNSILVEEALASNCQIDYWLDPIQGNISLYKKNLRIFMGKFSNDKSYGDQFKLFQLWFTNPVLYRLFDNKELLPELEKYIKTTGPASDFKSFCDAITNMKKVIIYDILKTVTIYTSPEATA